MNRFLHINKRCTRHSIKPLWQVSEHIISIFLKKTDKYICYCKILYLCLLWITDEKHRAIRFRHAYVLTGYYSTKIRNLRESFFRLK